MLFVIAEYSAAWMSPKTQNKCMFALLIPSSQSQGVFEGAQDIFSFYSTAYNT